MSLILSQDCKPLIKTENTRGSDFLPKKKRQVGRENIFNFIQGYRETGKKTKGEETVEECEGRERRKKM